MSTEPTPKERLGFTDTTSKNHPRALEECIYEIYDRLESLEHYSRLGKPIPNNRFIAGTSDCGPDAGPSEREAQTPQIKHPGDKVLDNRVFAEGHPIPDYDKVIEAMMEADKEVDELYEAIFRNAALEYIAAHKKFVKATHLSDKQLREQNGRIVQLHKIMCEASEDIV